MSTLAAAQVWEADNLQIDLSSLPKGAFVNVYQSLGAWGRVGRQPAVCTLYRLDARRYRQSHRSCEQDYCRQVRGWQISHPVLVYVQVYDACSIAGDWWYLDQLGW